MATLTLLGKRQWPPSGKCGTSFFKSCEEIINKDEFLLLYDVNKSKNPEYPYWNYERFKLPDKSETEFKTDFRFEKYDIPLLVEVHGLPDEIKCKQGTVCDGTEGLCIVLKQLAYSCRYSDLISIFGRPVPEIFMISNTVIIYSSFMVVGYQSEIKLF